MTQQTRSTGSAPHEDKERSSPHKGGAQAREAEGDGPVKPGLTSDEQPDLVPPSGINERDHGAADDKPMGGGPVNFDDDDELRPRGNTARSGGTWQAQGGDAGELGQSPGAGLSDRNGPSDPDAKRPARRRP